MTDKVDFDISSRSPAEHALLEAESAFGIPLEITARERPALLRHITRALNSEKTTITPSELIGALCLVRRRKWANQLMNKAQRLGDIWVRKSDVLTAADHITDPLISEEKLFQALDFVMEERWRTLSENPANILQEVRADLADSGHFLSSKQLERLSHSIAHAFGNKDLGFEDEVLLAEELRAREQEEIRQRAEERKKQELERLSQWENSLISFEEVPAYLHCSRKEALRWVAENRLPIAKRETQKNGLEIYYYDPLELRKCQKLLPLWRKGGKEDTKEDLLKGDKKGNAAIARIAALDRFAAHFKTARALKRRITLVTGPTNSGKSYTALNALANAESGIALAPLRLLAHEFREALTSRNVPTSLTTGEERIIDPTAKHLAATVEMCPFHNPVDVALIDEAQMLTDPDRGAAWTAAIMGVPARHIFILGAADCIPLVKKIAELCNDPVDEIHLERKSPLQTGGVVDLKELHSGDALIAFSRREVLDLRAELSGLNKRVAVIYGALSPEVRRAEAARFNNGDADILIATDAIGMGLNLSIRRVIFSTLRKYDGRQTRTLISQEIKQIGGRAGRFGKHENGLVCVLEGAGNPHFIRKMLEAPPEPLKELRPLVQPDSDIVQAVAQEMGSDSLYGVLVRIKHAVLRPNDPHYRLADMEQILELASALDGVDKLDLHTRWIYSMCPVNLRDHGVPRLVEWASIHAKQRKIFPPGTGRLPPTHTASNEDLGQAEKRHQRLVTWRWLAMRFPEIYINLDIAEKNAATLNDWIENVLRTQSQQRNLTRRGGQKKKGKGHHHKKKDNGHKEPIHASSKSFFSSKKSRGKKRT